MKQYIDKSALIAKIERRRSRNSKNKLNLAAAFEDNYLLSFIESLEVKEVDNIWHIASGTDLPKVGDVVCLIKDGRIISGEYRANKFYGKVCDGYDNSLEKGDKWCYLYGDLLKAEHLKKENNL